MLVINYLDNILIFLLLVGGEKSTRLDRCCISHTFNFKNGC